MPPTCQPPNISSFCKAVAAMALRSRWAGRPRRWWTKCRRDSQFWPMQLFFWGVHCENQWKSAVCCSENWCVLLLYFYRKGCSCTSLELKTQIEIHVNNPHVWWQIANSLWWSGWFSVDLSLNRVNWPWRYGGCTWLLTERPATEAVHAVPSRSKGLAQSGPVRGSAGRTTTWRLRIRRHDWPFIAGLSIENCDFWLAG